MEEPQEVAGGVFVQLVVDLAPDHQYQVVQAVAESVDHLLLHLVFCPEQAVA